MTTRDYTANVISATKVVPDGNFKDSKASGVWDINEALDLIKGGNWPNAANINPAAFVDALFQTHLYTGNGTAGRNIENGIDLTKGGLVWIKGRETGPGGGSQGTTHDYYDTERGVSQWLSGINDYASTAQGSGNGITAFNSNGFTIGSSYNGTENSNGEDTVAWTWREQPKFFDIVTYTGNGSTQDISHSLGSTPGMIWIKKTSATSEWFVWHRSVGNSHYLVRNTTAAKASYANWLNPTSTTISLQNDSTNNNSATYVAYFFAHNDGDGGFGAAGDQDIIKCDKYTGNGNATGPVIDLGFEPQYLLIKATTDPSGNGDWLVADNMRGLDLTDTTKILYANRNNAEQNASGQFEPTSTGFKITSTHTSVNNSGDDYIYMAIRRGGMQTPTAASDVFTVVKGQAANTTSVPGFTANHVVDFGISTQTSSSSNVTGTRLLGDTFLSTDANDAETSNSVTRTSGYQNGFFFTGGGADSARLAWMWARARGYFDVVAYSGTGSATTVTHNLGAVPEMMWVKARNATQKWAVYHSAMGNTKYVRLNDSTAEITSSTRWNDTTPTASVFTVGTDSQVNNSSYNYVAYLFATVAGVSKVGSYTGTGSDINIDCGFTSGARFVLIKNINAAEHWFVFDSVRGITTSTSDPFLYLSLTNAENTNTEIDIDPLDSGFKVAGGGAQINGNGNTHIFYAIA